MAGPFTAPIAFSPVEGALLEFYAKEYDSGVLQILRGMVRRVALLDRKLNVQDVKNWLFNVPELAENPTMMYEAKTELASFAAVRKGKDPTSEPKRFSRTGEGATPSDGENYRVRFSAFELLLIDFYSRWSRGWTREQSIRQFLLVYVRRDKKFDRKKFLRFAQGDVAKRLPMAQRERLHSELSVHFPIERTTS